VLVLDMIEILPPLGKYKYDTSTILPVKCYIDNFARLRSCIRNVNKHFWHHCWGGSHYLLSVYRLHVIILSSIISLIDLSAALWLFVVVIGNYFVRPESPTTHHSFLRFTSRFISIGLLGFLIRQVSKKSNQRDPRMNFNHLVDKTFTEAWEHYHGLNAEEARALFEKLSTSERESEEHGLKKNSRTVKIDPLTRKF
jgi:hypothetical protein